jgi:trehalose 6-phosphate synthase/phosphatase
VEVRNAGIDKGIAAMNWLSKKNHHSRFVIAIGNDKTDEDLFRVMPKGAYSIKVGIKPSYAKFHLNNPKEAIELLNEFL